MTQKIYKDGTDQYVLARLGSINNSTGTQGILLGLSEGYSLSNLIDIIVIVWSEYKKDDESISSDITWNSTAGMWKINIPSENITRYGTAWLNISGSDDSGISIIPTAIEVEVLSAPDFPAPSLIATAVWSGTEGAAVHTATTSTLTLAAINAEVDSAISDAGLVTNTAIDALPTAAEIVTAIDADVIEGTYTRLQVMRILAAVLAGTRANANDVDTFTGLDGATARVVASVSSTGRTITTLDGD